MQLCVSPDPVTTGVLHHFIKLNGALANGDNTPKILTKVTADSDLMDHFFDLNETERQTGTAQAADHFELIEPIRFQRFALSRQIWLQLPDAAMLKRKAGCHFLGIKGVGTTYRIVDIRMGNLR